MHVAGLKGVNGMIDPAREFLLRRAVEGLCGFAEETFDLGLDLLGDGVSGCLCALHPGGPKDPEACRAFVADLRSGGRSGGRCPEGLAVISRPVEVAPGRSLLLATHGFLAEGDPAAGNGDGPGAVPRLSAAQVRSLEDCIGAGAALVAALARGAVEAGAEVRREEAWIDLAGAPAFVGSSPAIRAVREALPNAANSSEPLFLEGEPGSGRALFAVSAHRLGPRREGPFIRENVAALPAALHESELFGSGEGDAGLVGEARGGTLYLAGADRLVPAAQARLLALLGRTPEQAPAPETRIVVSVSGAKGRGKGLSTALRARLETLRVAIPPLRERPGDIPLIVEHLLSRRSAVLGTPPVTVTPEALDALNRHPWTGNVRELDEEIARAAAGRSRIGLEDLSPAVARSARGAGAAAAVDLRHAVGELEREMIESALGETGWNKSRAAAQLGLSRLGLQKKIDRYRIDRRRQAPRPAGGEA